MKVNQKKEDNRGVYVCSYCGSPEVQSSAAVSWNEKKQDWVIDDIRDWPDDYCCNCEDECSCDFIYYRDFPEKVGSKQVVLLQPEHVEAEYSYRVDIYDRKLFLMDAVTKTDIDTMLILRKANQWQWEIVNEEATANA